MKTCSILGLLMLVVSCAQCKDSKQAEEIVWKSIDVTATAYNSVQNQTSNTPNIGAWGDTLRSDLKCIAVSRDLIALGIKHNTKVKISGLEGVYLVKDKMNKKWKKKIDIFMGTNIQKAKEWGVKKVVLSYEEEKTLIQ